VTQAVSGGLQFRNYQLFKSSNVSFGLAMAEAATEQAEETTEETSVEAYIRLNIKKMFFLSPHYQHFWNANGQKGINQGFIGLRTRVAF
jgi:hypothetical protein